MDYNDFLKEKEKIEKFSIAEQKSFYEQLLKNKHDKTEVHVMASFCYGQLVIILPLAGIFLFAQKTKNPEMKYRHPFPPTI